MFWERGREQHNAASGVGEFMAAKGTVEVPLKRAMSLDHKLASSVRVPLVDVETAPRAPQVRCTLTIQP